MKGVTDGGATTTVAGDPKITRMGATLRKFKLDELPQLINVMHGQMSLVGPRPDVPGFADCLVGDDRLILTVRPGITGPASLAFRDEEQILARVENPAVFNREILYPLKVRLNLAYIQDFSLLADLKYLALTGLGRSLTPAHLELPPSLTAQRTSHTEAFIK